MKKQYCFKEKINIILIIVFNLFLVSYLGCTFYSFSGSTLVGIKTVEVPIFGNTTTEFGLEQQLTDAVVSAINADNTLSIGERNASDALLEGRIMRISDAPLTYTAGEQVSEYKVEITVHIKFTDMKNRKTLLESDFTAFGEYPYPETATQNRQGGMQTAIQKLAQDIINKAVSGW